MVYGVWWPTSANQQFLFAFFKTIYFKPKIFFENRNYFLETKNLFSGNLNKIFLDETKCFFLKQTFPEVEGADWPVGLPGDRPVGTPKIIAIFSNFAIKWQLVWSLGPFLDDISQAVILEPVHPWAYRMTWYLSSRGKSLPKKRTRFQRFMKIYQDLLRFITIFIKQDLLRFLLFFQGFWVLLRVCLNIHTR